MPQSVIRSLDIFQKICGRDAFSSIGLVSTHWDEATEGLYDFQQCLQNENELRNSFWSPLVDRGSKMYQFNNTNASAWNIVNSLPLKPRKLLIQEEMGDKHLPLPETTAGRSMFAWLVRAAKSLRDVIERLVHLLGSTTLTSAGDISFEQLEREKVKATEELKGIEQQLDSRSLSTRPRAFTRRISFVIPQAHDLVNSH
ncbi:hypothetical protein AN958_12157 [Leucoagaricus sp. SymC.cos]|nr:hypothetical protein AN958_12157 [Leucoagaricus sp. SymC.cos]